MKNNRKEDVQSFFDFECDSIGIPDSDGFILQNLKYEASY